MKIQNTTKSKSNINFSANWYSKFNKALKKIVMPKSMLSDLSISLVDKADLIARKDYNPIVANPVRLSVKNGDKEFSFLFKDSPVYRINLTKKGVSICDFDIVHVKGDSLYEFYSSNEFHSRIVDRKSIEKYNNIIEEWMPRLISKFERIENRGLHK